ncbi:hypothetical protein [Telluribacter sp. SYSU D00476]|uniref:hypothetical protein n=1 Tax=Telluribacter sp. SYSU D00476 TaxID=2811430 RepID=UPI001FF1674A|nr:hypothetical protein [Telluribacter sp. SYSU D00476]
MKDLITERFALNGLLTIISLTIVFHVLVVLGVIPFEIVWGGRLQDRSQMLAFEIVSLGINLFMLAIICVRAGIVRINVHPMLTRVIFWAMFGLFLLNTVGNIFSNNSLERLIFTPLTLILSIFCFRVAVGKPGNV